eukprot:TRINITY_DN970_c1_g1_i1.p1 TRINITY_DN970_c1_g1~~TRINITY_DN970_c1_g1_i1.p1  ORF type:complete len:1013 (+),score=121.63 TRINITY_DN970_c1_g1_i1:1418-4456(+)
MNEKIVWKLLCSSRWVMADESELTTKRNHYIIPYDRSASKSVNVIDWKRYFYLRNTIYNQSCITDLTNWDTYLSYIYGLEYLTVDIVLFSLLMAEIYYENKDQPDYPPSSEQRVSLNLILTPDTRSIKWKKGTSSSEIMIGGILLYLTRTPSFFGKEWSRVAKQLSKLFRYAVGNGHYNLVEVCDRIFFRKLINEGYEDETVTASDEESDALIPLFYRISDIDPDDWRCKHDKREAVFETLYLRENIGKKFFRLFKVHIDNGLASGDKRNVFAALTVLRCTLYLADKEEQNQVTNTYENLVLLLIDSTHPEIRSAALNFFFYSMEIRDEKDKNDAKLMDVLIKAMLDPFKVIRDYVFEAFDVILDDKMVATFESELMNQIVVVLNRPEEDFISHNLLLFLFKLSSLMDKNVMKYYSLILDPIKTKLNKLQASGDVHMVTEIFCSISNVVLFFVDVDTDYYLNIIGPITEKFEELDTNTRSRIFKFWSALTNIIGKYFQNQLSKLRKVLEKYHPLLSQHAIRYSLIDTSPREITDEEEENLVLGPEETLKERKRISNYFDIFDMSAVVNKPLVKCKNKALDYILAISQHLTGLCSDNIKSYFSTVLDIAVSRETNEEIRVNAMDAVIRLFTIVINNKNNGHQINNGEHQDDGFASVMFNRICNSYLNMIQNLHPFQLTSETLYDVNYGLLCSFNNILKLWPKMNPDLINQICNQIFEVVKYLAKPDLYSISEDRIDPDNLGRIAHELMDIINTLIKKEGSRFDKIFFKNILDLLIDAEDVCKQTCICILDDLIDNSKIDVVAECSTLKKVFLENMIVSSHPLSQAASYGLGILLKNVPSSMIEKNVLTELINLMKKSSKESVVDNACSSLFKIFYTHPDLGKEYPELFDETLNFAKKMCSDKSEITIVVDILTDMYQTNWNDRFSSADGKKKILKVLKSLENNLESNNSDSDDDVVDFTENYLLDEWKLDKTRFQIPDDDDDDVNLESEVKDTKNSPNLIEKIDKLISELNRQ